MWNFNFEMTCKTRWKLEMFSDWEPTAHYQQFYVEKTSAYVALTLT